MGRHSLSIQGTDDIKSGFSYNGEVQDETGLIYLRARYYYPALFDCVLSSGISMLAGRLLSMLRGGKGADGADGIKNKLKYQHNMVENPGPLVDITQHI